MNREWVKTAAIIFLAVLLVLTFFSNTIMNRTLPEVASSEVTDGSITAKVRGTGVVSAIGNTEIKANGTQSVATVKAREGAEVSAGDVLFIMGEASEELEAAQESLDNARFSLMDAQNSYPVGGGSSSHYNTAYQAYEQAYNEYANAVEELKLHVGEDAKKIIIDTEAEVKTALSNLDSYKNGEYATGLQEAKTRYDQNLIDLGYDEAIKIYNAEIAPLDFELNLKQTSYDQVQSKYDAMLSYYNISESAKIALDAAERAVQDAINADNQAEASNNISAGTASIAVARAQKEVERWEKKVAELSGGEDNAITAPIAGTVSSLSVSPGDKVQKDQVMCIIEVPDLGYQMSFSATNDQAKRIKVGNKADVSNFYWGSTIEAEVASIKVDPKDPQNKKLVTVNLDGEVTTGADITVSIGEKSANYDVIVPNSAVRTDSNGSFVLAITAKNSPLGNRYFATRVPVEVLASDDSNSALNGNLSYGDFVITTSSSPIKNGDQVRLAANG